MGSHQLDINPFGHEKNPWPRIGEVTQSIVGSNSDPYLPDANITQLLGIEEQLQFAVFLCLGRFLQVSVSFFFFGQMVNKSTRKFSWKAAKKVSGLVKLCFLGRVFAYHLRSYPILAANKPENMRLDGSGQHLGGKTDGFLRNQGQQGAVGFRKMWGVDGFTRCEGYKMLGKSWWCFSNNFFLDGEKLVLNFKLTPRFLLTTGVKTLWYWTWMVDTSSCGLVRDTSCWDEGHASSRIPLLMAKYIQDFMANTSLKRSFRTLLFCFLFTSACIVCCVGFQVSFQCFRITEKTNPSTRIIQTHSTKHRPDEVL